MWGTSNMRQSRTSVTICHHHETRFGVLTKETVRQWTRHPSAQRTTSRAPRRQPVNTHNSASDVNHVINGARRGRGQQRVTPHGGQHIKSAPGQCRHARRTLAGVARRQM